MHLRSFFLFFSKMAIELSSLVDRNWMVHHDQWFVRIILAHSPLETHMDSSYSKSLKSALWISRGEWVEMSLFMNELKDAKLTNRWCNIQSLLQRTDNSVDQKTLYSTLVTIYAYQMDNIKHPILYFNFFFSILELSALADKY